MECFVKLNYPPTGNGELSGVSHRVFESKKRVEEEGMEKDEKREGGGGENRLLVKVSELLPVSPNFMSLCPYILPCLGCGTHKPPLRYLTPSLFLSLRLHHTVDKQTRHFVCWLPEQVGGGDEEGGGKERKGGL